VDLAKLFKDGNYVVIVAMFCGAIGIAYGLSQGVTTGQNAMLPVYQLLIAGTMWGVVGLLIGAIAMTIPTLGYWAIPVCVLIALIASQLDMVKH
jgi:hypothetical protein